MNEIPYAQLKWTSYENLAVECPQCGQMSIFNRATDLKDLEPIAFRTVSCLNSSCQKPFHIHGDTINSAHEMLVFDCYELIQLKHYMNAILSLAQAYEVFFSLFLRVELLYKPFAADPDKDIDHFNTLAEQLAKKVKNHTFEAMRALFLQQLISGPTPRTLTEAEATIASLDDHPKIPKNKELDSLPDKRLVALLKTLKASEIHSLRNQVVHKRAYRPTCEKVKAALEEARSLLFPLTQHLGIEEDINWYMVRKDHEAS